MTAQSALVVLVPEAEHLVGRFRERYDPGAALGMPAHVTLLIPFVAPGAIGVSLLRDLSALFSRHEPLAFTLGEIRDFPGVLYLRPAPAEPLKELTRAICEGFPDYPPYGGAHDDVRPHLTVGRMLGRADFDRLSADFVPGARTALPIACRGDEVTLVENASGRWQARARFALGRKEA